MGFSIYGRGGHLGHMTSIMLIFFLFPCTLHTKPSGFLRKANFNVRIVMTLDQGHEITLNFNTHIYIL